MKPVFLTICLFILTGCQSHHSTQTNSRSFHTPPDKWNEPRIYQSRLCGDFENRISIETIKESEIKGLKEFSPNNVYWCLAVTNYLDKSKLCNGTVYVYNERDYLICMELLDIKSGGLKTEWVNEKLLYIRVWLGRILAIDLIFDVEKENFIYREMTNWGAPVFEQWQQLKRNILY